MKLDFNKRLVNGLRNTFPLLLVGLFWAGSTSLATAAIFTVNSSVDAVDDVPGDGVCADASARCTLRAAIQEANALAGADEVVLSVGTYNLGISGAGEEAGATGDLDINSDIVLSGAGANLTFVDAEGIDRVFDVGPSVGGITVSISNMTLRNGNTIGNGGLIRNVSTLNLSELSLEGGQAAAGGAVHNNGAFTLERSLLHNNSASAEGGALFNGAGPALVRNSTFSGNDAGTEGGGVYNATGITLTLDFVTITANSASTGAGIANAGTLNLNSSILDANTTANCSNTGTVNSDGFNLDSANTCGLGMAELVNTSAQLDALLDNGGDTRTHALSTGSPAIDNGSNTCPPVDQRNVTRPVDGDGNGSMLCDIGAYEWTPSIDLAVTNVHDEDCVKKGKDVVYYIGVRNNGSGTATGVVLTDTLPKTVLFSRVSSGCIESNRVVTCDIGDLPAGARRSYTIIVNAPETAYLHNQVTVTANENDDNSTNNSADEYTRINCSACFIASAAYGSTYAPEVEVLRQFRDRVLGRYTIGRNLVNLYYHYSPAPAAVLNKNPWLATLVRTGLTPYIALTRLWMNMGKSSLREQAE